MPVPLSLRRYPRDTITVPLSLPLPPTCSRHRAHNRHPTSRYARADHHPTPNHDHHRTTTRNHDLTPSTHHRRTTPRTQHPDTNHILDAMGGTGDPAIANAT